MSKPPKKLFAVAKLRNGYNISLPKDLLAKFPESFRTKITLTSHTRGEHKSTIVGVGDKQSDVGLKVVTADRFAVDLADSSLLIDIRGIWMPGMKENKAFMGADFNALPKLYSYAAGTRRCHGCTRDSTLNPYTSPWGPPVGDSICYCVAQVMRAR